MRVKSRIKEQLHIYDEDRLFFVLAVEDAFALTLLKFMDDHSGLKIVAITPNIKNNTANGYFIVTEKKEEKK